MWQVVPIFFNFTFETEKDYPVASINLKI